MILQEILSLFNHSVKVLGRDDTASVFSRRHATETAYCDYKSICAGNCPLKLIISRNFILTCPLPVQCSDACDLVTLTLYAGFSLRGPTLAGEAQPTPIRCLQRKHRSDSRWILMFAKHDVPLHCSPKRWNQSFRKHPCRQPQSRLIFHFLNVNTALVTDSPVVGMSLRRLLTITILHQCRLCDLWI